MSNDPAASLRKDVVVDVGDLEDNIGFLVRQAQLAIFQDLIAVLRPWGLRVTDFSVLMIIDRTPGLNQQAISIALRVHPPNLNTIMDKLLQQNLVCRTPMVADRRAYAVNLTPQGEHVLALAREAHADHNRRLGAHIAGVDVQAVREALKRIATF